MKLLKKILTIFLLIIGIGFILVLVPKPQYQKENPFLGKDFPLVMAHAGGKGVYPDNTMLAYMYSFSIGVDVLEMDVMLTKDGILVLLHGENQTGNTRSHSNCDTVVWQEDYEYLYQNCNFGYHYQEKNGDYLYKNMTSEQWQDAYVYLPTLEEVFIQFGNQILYNIEIKADSDAPRLETADALYELITLYHLEDYVLVACAFDDINLHLVKNYPNLYVSTAYGSAQKRIISIYTLTSIFGKSPVHAAVQVPTSYNLPVIGKLRLDTKLLIRTLKQHNMAMHYWTVNDEETMRFLIEQGADGIITDYPELLISIINEYKNE